MVFSSPFARRTSVHDLPLPQFTPSALDFAQALMDRGGLVHLGAMCGALGPLPRWWRLAKALQSRGFVRAC